jgi:hypothetical protein
LLHHAPALHDQRQALALAAAHENVDQRVAVDQQQVGRDA